MGRDNLSRRCRATSPLPVDLTAMEADSVVHVTQVAIFDRAALDERMCVLPDWTMDRVDAGLGYALALVHL